MSLSKNAVVGVLVAWLCVGLGTTGCQVEGEATLAGAAKYFGPIGPVRLVHAMPASRSAAPGPKRPDDEGAQMPDSRVRLVVGMKLEQAELPVDDLEIEVDGQVVTLRGTAPELLARDRAELVARSVDGVRDVDNQIDVPSLE